MKPALSKSQALKIVNLVKRANECVRRQRSNIKISTKLDGSVVTTVDKQLDMTIERYLRRHFPKIRIVSEEKTADRSVSRFRALYWLVDPLDGTLAFIQKDGQFTVNIALVRGKKPIFGIIGAPNTGAVYFGNARTGNFSCTDRNSSLPKRVPQIFKSRTKQILVSKHHQDHSKDVLRLLEERGYQVRTESSSYKFIELLKNKAFLYLRLAESKEWDTAAGQALLGEGKVRISNGRRLRYSKPSYVNSNFVASSRGFHSWPNWLEALL